MGSVLHERFSHSRPRGMVILLPGSTKVPLEMLKNSDESLARCEGRGRRKVYGRGTKTPNNAKAPRRKSLCAAAAGQS